MGGQLLHVISVLLLLNVLVTISFAKIITKEIEYKDGSVVLEGYLAYDDSKNNMRPGVMVIHEWNGLQKYVKQRAEQLAALGYTAFCVDIYGKGIRPLSTDESSRLAGIYRSDIKLMRRRAKAGLQELMKQPFVDIKKIAAIGYCFGGGVALELARSGENIKGVVSFHGNLDTPDPKDARNCKSKVLIFHGANDTYTSAQVPAVEKEMNDANVDWQLVTYGGAVHGFTNMANGDDSSKGLAYNKKADKRSWAAMRLFFDELFNN